MALTSKKLKAINLLVYSTLQKQEIAKEVNVSASTMSVWLAEDEFQEALKEEMNRGFQEMARKARRKLDKLIESENEQVALAASKEVLNKAGYQETQKIEQNITTDIVIEITE